MSAQCETKKQNQTKKNESERKIPQVRNCNVCKTLHGVTNFRQNLRFKL